MYINPFLAGILSTIIVEMLIIIGFGIVNGNKNNKSNNDKEDN